MEILLIIGLIGAISLIVWLLFMLIATFDKKASDFYFDNEEFFGIFVTVSLIMFIVPIIIWVIINIYII